VREGTEDKAKKRKDGSLTDHGWPGVGGHWRDGWKGEIELSSLWRRGTIITRSCEWLRGRRLRHIRGVLKLRGSTAPRQGSAVASLSGVGERLASWLVS
jgi:hypothetical protein